MIQVNYILTEDFKACTGCFYVIYVIFHTIYKLFSEVQHQVQKLLFIFLQDYKTWSSSPSPLYILSPVLSISHRPLFTTPLYILGFGSAVAHSKISSIHQDFDLMSLPYPVASPGLATSRDLQEHFGKQFYKTHIVSWLFPIRCSKTQHSLVIVLSRCTYTILSSFHLPAPQSNFPHSNQGDLFKTEIRHVVTTRTWLKFSVSRKVYGGCMVGIQ